MIIEDIIHNIINNIQYNCLDDMINNTLDKLVDKKMENDTINKEFNLYYYIVNKNYDMINNNYLNYRFISISKSLIIKISKEDIFKSFIKNYNIYIPEFLDDLNKYVEAVIKISDDEVDVIYTDFIRKHNKEIIEIINAAKNIKELINEQMNKNNLFIKLVTKSIQTKNATTFKRLYDIKESTFENILDKYGVINSSEMLVNLCRTLFKCCYKFKLVDKLINNFKYNIDQLYSLFHSGYTITIDYIPDGVMYFEVTSCKDVIRFIDTYPSLCNTAYIGDDPFVGYCIKITERKAGLYLNIINVLTRIKNHINYYNYLIEQIITHPVDEVYKIFEDIIKTKI